METPRSFDETSWLAVEDEAIGDPATVACAPPPPPPPRKEPPVVARPIEVALQPGSFAVSTLAVATMLLMIGVTVVAFAASGMLAGMGAGLALVALLI